MKIALLGDMAFIGKYDVSKNECSKLRLAKVKSFLSEYDYVIGNLESPLTDKANTWVCKSIHVHSPKQNIELLKYLGVNVVSLANNHMFDFGQKGLDDTINELEDAGIEWIGYGRKYITLKTEADKVNCSGFCCYTTNGVNLGTKEKCINLLCREAVDSQILIDNVEKAKSLFLIHWGEEHTHYPMTSTVSIAHSILDKKEGTIICGAHTHCIQGIEEYRHGAVAYSLGNLIFDDVHSLNGRFVVRQTEENKKSFIWEIILDGDFEMKQRPIFLQDLEDGIDFVDLSKEMNEYSARIKNYLENDYQELRKKEISEVRKVKFGKKNFKWLISKLNYYSIGTKITNYRNPAKYRKVCEGFEENER